MGRSTDIGAPDALGARQAELLESAGLLDGVPDADLDAIVRLAAAVTGLPMAAVHLFDADTQHQVATHGFPAASMPRPDTLCAVVPRPAGAVLVVDDLAADPRFRDHPLVDGRLGRVRAYASAPLEIDGTPVGSLCVFDDQPHRFRASDGDRLADLAALVVGTFHRRRQALQLAVLAAESQAAQAQAEAAHAGLVRTEAFSRALLDALPVGVAATDPAGRLTTVNRALRGWLGLDERPVDLAGLEPADLPAALSLVDGSGRPLAPEDLALRRVLDEGGVRDRDAGIALPGQPVRLLSVAGTQVRGEDGRLLGAVLTMADVTAQRSLEAALRTAALHDPLTGLANRTLLVDRLEQALRTGRRTGTPLTLLYCDLDGFKAVNDTLGHATGDEVLVEAGRRLAAAVRPGDTVARMGGDEFVVLCPDLGSPTAARDVAARVAAAFAAPVRTSTGAQHAIGVSVGVALCSAEDTAESALGTADAAMYRVKQARRSLAAGACPGRSAG
ncbi:diguanylate cyclase domain-containing protein [Geodermatophilus sp. DSM 44513]|uniref:diguanylate cyclase domain-containing protein n=1 Tax=Geodermatophilus sp. DSM 44513 TaxID=1528104 RepID=UPI00127BEECF|nr:diguanylate cyclase [Geodermatophilus sp. DSM 44513]WNV75924.1 diguanylate cyclase [Geodermatophilus sp. DSM 44513]